MMNMKKWTLLICILFFTLRFGNIAFAQEVTLFNNKVPSAPFLALSDIHFNPFFTCTRTVIPCPLVKELMATDYTKWDAVFAKYDSQKMPAYGEDTNFVLLQSMLIAIQNSIKEYKPKFILITGDFLAHHQQQMYQLYSGDLSQQGYEDFVKKQIQFLTAQLQKYTQNTPIYPAIGNNDSYDGDYAVAPNGQFYADLASIWSPLLKDSDNEAAFLKTFPVAGYYEVTVPGETHHKIIVLNSVLFTKKAHNKNINIAAHKELDWLSEQMHTAELQQQKIWLVAHIPVGIDVYRTLQNPLHWANSFWLQAYTQAFQEIIDFHYQETKALIVAHTHMDNFYLMKQDNQKLPEIFIPAISPSNKTNPAFKVFSYNPRSFYIQNFAVFTLPLNLVTAKALSWQLEYVFNQMYQPHCQHCTLGEGMQKIAKRGNTAAAYKKYFEAGSTMPQPINTGKWFPYYWCAISNISVEDYKACLKG